jgi:LacI family transcriptional regulator
VRQSTIEIARLAGNSLIERDTRDGVAWDRVVTMPYELVTRQSMAPAVR